MEKARDLVLSPDQRVRSLWRESGLASTAFHQVWWGLVRLYLGVAHRLRVIGREHLPTEPPFILAGNHSSHLDALVLAAPLSWRLRDQIFPIAAGDVFFVTWAKSVFAALLLNALPLWRKNCGTHALEELRKRLVEEPCSYILFPEGKRSRDGKMLPFKPGLGMLVAQTRVPVVPCYITGAFEALRPETNWPRLGRRITVRVGPALCFEKTDNDRAGWKSVATALREAVEKLAEQGEARIHHENTKA
jgi:1-acyl-sn-glycerol-3-phosphate acyltransferase